LAFGKRGENKIVSCILLYIFRYTEYTFCMILSWKDSGAGRFFETGRVPKKAGWQQAAKIVARKLDMLNAAHRLEDLRSPPGNRLEALSGGRKGQHSIRINDQWRICFAWRDGPQDVEIVDYH